LERLTPFCESGFSSVFITSSILCDTLFYLITGDYIREFFVFDDANASEFKYHLGIRDKEDGLSIIMGSHQRVSLFFFPVILLFWFGRVCM